MKNFVEAYKCTCGHIMPFYTEPCGYMPPMPFFTFYHCCPKCGRKKGIKVITGQWTYKRIILGFWPFRVKKDIKDTFIEAII